MAKNVAFCRPRWPLAQPHGLLRETRAVRDLPHIFAETLSISQADRTPLRRRKHRIEHICSPLKTEKRASPSEMGQKPIWLACRTLSGKTLNVGARHGGVASRSGADTNRVDFVRHSAVWAFPHVHHHLGYRLAYPATPKKRARSPCSAQCIVLASLSITSKT